jgi:putative transposase
VEVPQEQGRIQKPPKPYSIIDVQSLSELSGFADLRDFQRAHRQWVEQGLENGLAVRDDRWSEAIAIGSLAFVENVKNQLGIKASHRNVIEADGSYALREPAEAYAGKFTGKNEALRTQNTFVWNDSADDART